jgi:hypothetical protein
MQADKVTIVGETVDYIKTSKGTLVGLEELKLERIRAQLLGAQQPCSTTPTTDVPRRCTTTGGFKGVNPDGHGQQLERRACGAAGAPWVVPYLVHAQHRGERKRQQIIHQGVRAQAVGCRKRYCVS